MKWNLKALIFWHLLAVTLVLSLLWDVTAVYWRALDVSFFRFINSNLETSTFAQTFWACANLRLADWLEDVVFLIFFIFYVRQFSRFLWSKKISELFICVLCGGAVIAFVNHGIFRHLVHITRLSPTLVLENTVRLSDHLSWIKVKTQSSSSFPGDHATTALFFGAVFYYLGRGRLRLLACCYSIFLCFPRMVVGAHWLSDVIVGSGGIVMIATSWMFCTPFFEKASSLVRRGWDVSKKWTYLLLSPLRKK